MGTKKDKIKNKSNWSTLRDKIGTKTDEAKKKRTDLQEALESLKEKDSKAQKRVEREVPADTKAKYVGLDCEMVGTGEDGRRSVLARACLVNFDGEVIYDRFVRPQEYVTDFRTKYSGVRKADFRKNDAITLRECQYDVAALIKDKYLVGHALKNDLDVLLLSHPRTMIRDTATYRPYMRTAKFGKFKPRALRDLTKQFLDYTIQTGEHDPGEDARAAMHLYIHQRDEWEADIRQRKKEAAMKGRAASLTGALRGTAAACTDVSKSNTTKRKEKKLRSQPHKAAGYRSGKQTLRR